MAKASSIYVVTDARDKITMTFTVRRELRTWLESQQVPFVYTVTTYPDGVSDRLPYSVPASEFLRVVA